MTSSIELIFDFASPNGYLAWQGLIPIAARTGARIELVPALLGGVFKATNNQAPFVAFGGVTGKLAYEMLEIRRFVRDQGLDRFRFNPHFPVNSLLVMRAWIAARRDGRSDAFAEAVSRALWEEGLLMSDPAVVAGVLTSAGLDAEALIAAAGQADVKAELADLTAAAVARGVFGVPTIFVGDEMFFGKERLAQIEAELIRAASPASGS